MLRLERNEAAPRSAPARKDLRKLPSPLNKILGPDKILVVSPRCCKLHTNYNDK